MNCDWNFLLLDWIKLLLFNYSTSTLTDIEEQFKPSLRISRALLWLSAGKNTEGFKKAVFNRLFFGCHIVRKVLTQTRKCLQRSFRKFSHLYFSLKKKSQSTCKLSSIHSNIWNFGYFKSTSVCSAVTVEPLTKRRADKPAGSLKAFSVKPRVTGAEKRDVLLESQL